MADFSAAAKYADSVDEGEGGHRDPRFCARSQRDYAAAFATLRARLTRAEHAAANSKAADVDKRSAAAAAIVVDYGAPEARAAHQLLDQVVVAQDAADARLARSRRPRPRAARSSRSSREPRPPPLPSH
jgi:hypothetical protein